MSTVMLYVCSVVVVFVCIYLTALLREDNQRVCENCVRKRKSTSTGSYQGYFCVLRKQEVKPWNTCNQFIDIQEIEQ